jgi:hypothetical protein
MVHLLNSIDDERDFQVDAVRRDLVVLHDDLLLLDPRRTDPMTLVAAFAIPSAMASSKLFVDSELISITLAIAMSFSFKRGFPIWTQFRPPRWHRTSGPSPGQLGRPS